MFYILSYQTPLINLNNSQHVYFPYPKLNIKPVTSVIASYVGFPARNINKYLYQMQLNAPYQNCNVKSIVIMENLIFSKIHELY